MQVSAMSTVIAYLSEILRLDGRTSTPGFAPMHNRRVWKRGDRKMKNVQLITDGSCIGNPGPGGWACILRCRSEERELSGSEARTTNNRMELAAAINGLRALRESCEVELVTDSQYLKQGITEHLA